MMIAGLQLLAQFIHDYCGLDYTGNLSSLEAKLSRRIQELSMSYSRYTEFIKEDAKERDYAITQLTINETYFYREHEQLHQLRDLLIEKYRADREATIRIWSAACSSGEEPYSISMVIQDTLELLGANIEIYASDIDKDILARAQQARYGKTSMSFRRIPERWLQLYFREEQYDFVIIHPVKQRVQFLEVNLLDKGAIQQLPKFDIIICRNVLIYFDEPTVKQVVTSFYQQLTYPGYLMLGHVESITKFQLPFTLSNTGATFYYVKEGQAHHEGSIQYPYR